VRERRYLTCAIRGNERALFEANQSWPCLSAAALRCCAPACRFLVRVRRRELAPTKPLRAKSCPNEPTVYTLNDAVFAQFAVIRSVAVRTCDYGSGGRGFESLPARNTSSASQDHREAVFRVSGFLPEGLSTGCHAQIVTNRWAGVASLSTGGEFAGDDRSVVSCGVPQVGTGNGLGLRGHDDLVLIVVMAASAVPYAVADDDLVLGPNRDRWRCIVRCASGRLASRLVRGM
jgi:hypothetical protein